MCSQQRYSKALSCVIWCFSSHEVILIIKVFLLNQYKALWPEGDNSLVTQSGRAGVVNHTKAVLFVRLLLWVEFVCSGVLGAFMLGEDQTVERRQNKNIIHVFQGLLVRFVSLICVKCVFDPIEGSSAPLLTSATVVMSRL